MFISVADLESLLDLLSYSGYNVSDVWCSIESMIEVGV